MAVASSGRVACRSTSLRSLQSFDQSASCYSRNARFWVGKESSTGVQA